ncbi:MAG: orotidine-5'-phosphate decarboxylase [Mariprofundaceae bacterium]|nr:orotidine-5'-phosphate decarboxylase [Mariprofundaceae bacterium]
MENRIMVALDVADAREALMLRQQLIGAVGWLKVGLRLFVAEGPSLIAALQRDHRIFLDLKFHDIPNTVQQAVESAGKLGVDMVNVHAAGGMAMLQAAAVAAKQYHGMKLIAVTVLTSTKTNKNTEQNVLERAVLAKEAGLDGVVSSVHEVAAIKNSCGENFITVTPGIRWALNSADDQARVATPKDAVLAGADYLVIGRPIVQAKNPAKAASEVVAMMKSV